MVDLHGDNSHRLARGREGHLLLLQRFRRFPVSSDPEPVQPYLHFELLGLNAGQFNADSKAGSALENVDRRTPLNDRIVKIGEMDFGDLVGDLANLALEKSQAKSTGFSAHHPQWMRWAGEATGKSSGVARSSLLYRYASPHPDTQPGTVFAA